MARSRLIRLFVLLVAAWLFAIPQIAVARDANDVQAAVDRVFSSGRIQGDLPDGDQRRVDDDSSTTTTGRGGGGGGGAPRVAVPVASGLASGLGWAALALGVILLVLWLLGLRGGRESSGDVAAPSTVVARPAERIVLSARSGVESRALELANAGRIDDAVHDLLLDAAARVLARVGRTADVALTSREIMGQAGLAGEQETSFSTLVSLVERSHFGGRPLAMTDFERGYGAYRTLAVERVA